METLTGGMEKRIGGGEMHGVGRNTQGGQRNPQEEGGAEKRKYVKIVTEKQQHSNIYVDTIGVLSENSFLYSSEFFVTWVP